MAFPPTDWIDWTPTEYEVGAPATSLSFERWFRNPVALAQGAADAPRIEDAAMDVTATTAGRDWVLNRTALAQAGAVGVYGLFQLTNPSTLCAPGTVVPGSDLAYANVLGAVGGFSPIVVTRPSGSWRCMGRTETGSNTVEKPEATTTFLRIS